MRIPLRLNRWPKVGRPGSAYLIRRIPPYGVIVFALLLAYLPTFSGDFIFDDRALVRDNSYITKLQSMSSYLSQEDGVVDPLDKGVYRTGYYRPLISFTFFVDYWLWGMKASGFRTTNWLFHVLTCLLLYELMLMMTQRGGWSLLGALFFAMHPVQTEAVSIIVARNNIFSTFFMLISLFAYIRWWERKSALALVCSLTAFAGALFSKEFGLMTLPILLLYQRFLSRERETKREISSYVPYLVIMIIYLVLRGHVVTSSFTVSGDFFKRLYFAPYLVLYNLKLIFFPHGLHSFYVVYPQSMLDVMVLLSFLLLLLLFYAIYRYRKNGLLIFAASAFLLSLVPVLNLVRTSVVSLIAMRWLYMPLAFVALGVVWALGRVPRRRSLLVLLSCTLVLIYLGGYSFTLNKNLWHDERTSVEREVLIFHNPLFFGDYAEKLFQEGNLDQAAQYFALALQARTAKVRDYIKYGALLFETKRFGEAVQTLEKARGLTMTRKERADWHNNMGVALTMARDFERAHGHMREALILDGNNPLLRRNMAALLLCRGRLPDAAAQLDAAARMELSHRR
ncbi:MAG TPA: hypothetical protein PLG94_04155 [Smithellaceae bacterium]|nr:hypothetical protein [Smithellaceae bacterium]HPL65694.1 hypothetical protein [Smithellaceae bacterium]HQB13549.1 hypothetical protein [Syntrophales bacterium]